MKKLAKRLVAAILGWQVRRLAKKNQFITIGVVGSTGKTSTKFAIAHVLSGAKRVRFQPGNYNDIVSVPLIFFGHEMPNVLDIVAWLKIFISNEKILRTDYPYDAVIVELGTDGPGQIAEFGSYIKLDYAVVTAITQEHMEYFADIDAVAKEELSVSKYAPTVLVNSDLCDSKYIDLIEGSVVKYGRGATADFVISDVIFNDSQADFKIINQSSNFALSAEMNAVSIAELYSATSASIIAHLLDIADDQIRAGINSLRPVAGRMQRLRGVKDSLLIDDTYNASPAAVKTALESLYTVQAPQKIALLGSMNELGAYSEQAHKEIGRFCDPNNVDLVVTVGQDANNYLAQAAEANGCKVARFDSPYDAARHVRSRLQSGAVVLSKGSQNQVFMEEAVKMLLADQQDSKKLVRQSAYWMKIKETQFGKVPYEEINA